MQLWYDKNEPSNGLILVTFNDVSRFEYDDNIADKIFDELDNEIWEADIDDVGLKFFSVETIYKPNCEDIYWTLKINAANVEVEELERYNL